MQISNYAASGPRMPAQSRLLAGPEYIGLGPSAFSTVGGLRWKNVSDTCASVVRVAERA